MGADISVESVTGKLNRVGYDAFIQAKAKAAWKSAEKSGTKSNPPDKRLPEIRKKLESLEKLGQVPKPSAGDTP